MTVLAFDPTIRPTAPLTERALLVSLSISEWRGRRHDREVTATVAREHGADETAGCYTKALVPRRYLAQIAQVRTKARTLHQELTLPWCDEGFRILPVDLHLRYMESFRELRTDFQSAVDKFLAAYDDAKAAAKVSLGTLYSEDDYPSVSQLQSAFSMDIRPQPLPAGHDWRIDLPAEAVERIRLDLETRLNEAQRLATADLYRRLASVVSHMASTLAVPDKIFRDSLVTNVRELCDVLPALNIANDPALADLAIDIEDRLASLSPTALRNEPSTRESAAQDAAALLEAITERLSSYTGTAA
jgi:hypothetical protein